MGDFGSPFGPLVGPLVLVVHVEPGSKSVLSGERLFGLLCTWGTMQVENDIESSLSCPITNTLEVGKSALGEVFAGAINEVFIDPISKGECGQY